MAYYRQKYDKGGGVQTARSPQPGRGRNRKEKSTRPQKPVAESAITSQKKTAAPGAAPETGKKGILSRLLGIFKKS